MGLQPALCGAGKGGPAGALGSDLTAESQTQVHAGAGPREVSIPPENLTVLAEPEGAIVRPRPLGSSYQPPTLPGGLLAALSVLFLPPPLATAGSHQSRLTSRGRRAKQRVLIFTLSSVCPEQASLPELPLIPGRGGSLLPCALLEGPAWEGRWSRVPLPLVGWVVCRY